MIASAASVGLAIGSATRVKICHSLTPSTCAASKSSAGIIEKAWRMNSTPSELNSGGTISANQVFARPEVARHHDELRDHHDEVGQRQRPEDHADHHAAAAEAVAHQRPAGHRGQHDRQRRCRPAPRRPRRTACAGTPSRPGAARSSPELVAGQELDARGEDAVLGHRREHEHHPERQEPDQRQRHQQPRAGATRAGQSAARATCESSCPLPPQPEVEERDRTASAAMV